MEEESRNTFFHSDNNDTKDIEEQMLQVKINKELLLAMDRQCDYYGYTRKAYLTQALITQFVTLTNYYEYLDKIPVRKQKKTKKQKNAAHFREESEE